MLEGLVNKILSLIHYRPSKDKGVSYAFKKNYLVEYAGVKWRIDYVLYRDGTQEDSVEVVPYCKKCRRQFIQKDSMNKELSNFKCPVCGDTKKGYPLMTNYRAVINLAEAQINDLRKSLSVPEEKNGRI